MTTSTFSLRQWFSDKINAIKSFFATGDNEVKMAITGAAMIGSLIALPLLPTIGTSTLVSFVIKFVLLDIIYNLTNIIIGRFYTTSVRIRATQHLITSAALTVGTILVLVKVSGLLATYGVGLTFLVLFSLI